MAWNVRKLAEAVGGEAHIPKALFEQEIGGVVIDSRKLLPGDVFIATKGERVDGHSFIPQVMEKGALFVICEDAPQGDIPYIKVRDSFAVLKAAAKAYRALLTIPVVAVTGSVGKTSTKEMIASVLSEKYNVLKTEGNYNNEIGMPLTILQIRKEHTAAVLELGINHFGEMERLSDIARPDIAVITAIAECHLEALGDLDGVLKAKSEIFTHMGPESTVILNGDDEKLRTIKEVHGKAPIFYHFGEDGCEPELDCPMVFPLPGIHQRRNALAAAAVGRVLGVSDEQIVSGLKKVRAVGGRGDVIDTGRYTVLNDCYNANPTSTRAGLSTLCEDRGAKRRVAVLGDMLELGKEERALHYRLGEYAGKAGPELLITIGPLSEETDAGFAAAAPSREHYHFAGNGEFLEKAGELLKEGDRILLKASHGMHFEEILKKLKEM